MALTQSRLPGHHDGQALESVRRAPDVVDLPRPYWVASNQRQSVLLDGARVLLRHKLLFLTIALSGAGLGYLSTLPRAPVYRARTLLDIQPLNENFFNMRSSDARSATAATSVNAESFLQTQIKLLQSNFVIERVVNKLKSGSPDEAGRGDPAPAGAAAATPAPVSDQSVIAQAASTFKVRPVGATRLVEVLCDGPTPQRAMTFCNTLATEFIESSLEVRSDTAQRTSQWLTGQLSDLRKNLATSEERLQNYARIAALVFSPDKETIAQERLRNLQNELMQTQAERIGKQSQYELAMTQPAASLKDAADSPVLREYAMRLTDLQRQRADLAVGLTDSHPRVQRLDAQIAELSAGVRREQEQLVARAKNELDAATKRETLLQARFAEQFATVSGQAEKAVTYNMLRREVESDRQLYETMLQRVREAGFASAMRDSTIRVVDLAPLPETPISPSVPVSVATGLALGCLVGIGVVFLRDSNDGRIRRPVDVTVQLGVPELGVIPGAGGRRLLARYGAGHGNPADSRLLPRPELLTLTHSVSPVAEAFRATMNSVVFAIAAEGESRVIVVTSPGVGDGKTTLAMNLSVALAETGRRVLLVDADMRQPKLHEIAHADNSFGLHDVLASENAMASFAFDQLAQPTAIQKFWLLTAGTPPMNVSKLLHSHRLAELVTRLRRHFDFVVFDTPPLMPVSDARLFARVSDGVVLVIRANQTTHEDALRARNVLAADGATILGTIFNDWRGSRPVDYYYGRSSAE